MNKESVLSLLKAKRDLHRFLSEHPEMEEYQKKLEEKLDKCETPEERMALIGKLMRENLDRLTDKFKEIHQLTNKIIK